MSCKSTDSDEMEQSVHICGHGIRCECDENCNCQEPWRAYAPPKEIEKFFTPKPGYQPEGKPLDTINPPTGGSGVPRLDSFAITLPTDISAMAAKLRELLTHTQLVELGSHLFPGFPDGVPVDCVRQEEEGKEADALQAMLAISLNNINKFLKKMERTMKVSDPSDTQHPAKR